MIYNYLRHNNFVACVASVGTIVVDVNHKRCLVIPDDKEKYNISLVEKLLYNEITTLLTSFGYRINKIEFNNAVSLLNDKDRETIYYLHDSLVVNMIHEIDLTN